MIEKVDESGSLERYLGNETWTLSVCLFYTTEVLLFNVVQLITFFVICTFDIISKKPLPNPKSGKFTPMFSPKAFILSALVSS